MNNDPGEIEKKRSEICLVRHGETEWSRDMKHTGRTDIPLTERGRKDAELVGIRLSGLTFSTVLTSPLKRALETCRIAGFGDQAQKRDDLMEWDYGDYEGLKLVDIRKRKSDWLVWDDGAPEGESVEQVGNRVDKIIGELREASGDTLIFAHGHLLRILTARWLDLPPGDGRMFALSTGAICKIGYERDRPVILSWNETFHLR